MKNNRNNAIIILGIILNIAAFLILFFLIFRLNNGLNYAVEKGTRREAILTQKIECAKNPSSTCEEEIEKSEAEFEKWNEAQLK
ncbi:MAG: hypothetical protein Q4A27_00515 [bacterium]|nr:hypothetical protein [bacterium]